MRNKKIRIRLLAGIFSLATPMAALAQTPGNWDGGGMQTTATNPTKALGIGTTTPVGWGEINYCDDYQKGLVVTANPCGLMSQYVQSFDGYMDEYTIGTPSGGPYVAPVSYLLNPFSSIQSQPMIWGRIQNANGAGVGNGTYTSRFMVTPAGRSGFNIEDPRATVDIKSLDGADYPALIVGRQVPHTTNVTKHVMFVPLCNTKSYNHIVQQGDYGIFFTDGQGTSGADNTGSLVIAPWANNDNGAVGGLRIDNMGNLAEAGQLTAMQLNVVAQWWSDFVFDKDYKLASLESVNDYIKLNKHLPGIPSADELKKSNLNLGDMEAKQMQKIEELTLYSIDQDKKLNQQSDRIAKQQQEIDELNKKLNSLLDSK